MIHLTISTHQAMLMMDLGVDGKLSVDLSKSMLLTEADLDTILRFVPRRGRTGMSLRRKVAHLKAKQWLQRAEKETDVTLCIEALVTIRVASNVNIEAARQAIAEFHREPNGQPLTVLKAEPQMTTWEGE